MFIFFKFFFACLSVFRMIINHPLIILPVYAIVFTFPLYNGNTLVEAFGFVFMSILIEILFFSITFILQDIKIIDKFNNWVHGIKN